MNNRVDATPLETPGARRAERWLRRAFLAGAVTDALATIPLLEPTAARFLWNLETGGGSQQFAARSAAALMAGWTLLLLWAYRKPQERRGVAALTLVVLAGLVWAGIAAVAAGVVPVGRMVPTWVVQTLLAALFARAFFGRPEPSKPGRDRGRQ